MHRLLARLAFSQVRVDRRAFLFGQRAMEVLFHPVGQILAVECLRHSCPPDTGGLFCVSPSAMGGFSGFSVSLNCEKSRTDASIIIALTEPSGIWSRSAISLYGRCLK